MFSAKGYNHAHLWLGAKGTEEMRMKKIVDKISSPRTIFLAGVVVIIVACFVTYIPAIRGGFIWEDVLYVTVNPMLTAPHGLYLIWFSSVQQLDSLGLFPTCRLVYTTFWIEHHLWGFNPMGYHAVNVAIHITNALLLWLVLRRMSIPGAWFVSAVFALHPVQVESVAWITELKNTLMMFFALLTVLCWMKSEFDDKLSRKALLFYASSLLLYALALLGKSTACTLPLAFILILWFKHVPLTAKRLLLIVPFLTMGIGTGLYTMRWQISSQGMGIINLGLSPAAKLIIAGRALWFYLWKLFWPVNLTFSYPRWHVDPTSIWQYAWPVSFVIAIFLCGLWRKRIGRAPLAALLFFALTLFPMLGFFYIFTFIFSFVADHYQYAACIGPIALVAAVGVALFGRSGKNVKLVIISMAGILLLILGTLTYQQCKAYKNSDTIWADTLKKNPSSWLAHGSIGVSLCAQGEYLKALYHFEEGIKFSSYMKAIYPSKYALSYHNAGSALLKLGRLNEAVVYYQKSLDIWEYSADVHIMLGGVLARQGNTVMAKVHILRALEITKERNDSFSQIFRMSKDQLVEELQKELKLLEEQKRDITSSQKAQELPIK